MARQVEKIFMIISLALPLMIQDFFAASRKFQTSNTFYIRHFHGKCVEYDEARLVLVYGRLCREKFEWQGGARLIHIPTKKCVTVNATSDGSFLSLSSQCSDTNSLFQYDENNRVIRHLFTNKCLHPETGDADPAINTAIVLKVGCEENINKFYFRKKAYYIIRHFGGLCWVYISGENLIKLMNPFACDRFEYVNNYHLRHVETGKCVIFSSSFLRLTDDCESLETIYKLNQNSLLQHGASRCVHPYTGKSNAPIGDLLLLFNDGCTDEDRLRFSFYDDKDILQVKIVSETCSDIEGTALCNAAKGHVIVNGGQYSFSGRGINVVLFDYRSGLFEHRATYEIYSNQTHRVNLVKFLNKLPSEKLFFMSAKDAVKMDGHLALALQRVGVSATFATAPVPNIFMSLAFVRYTGQVRKDWEKSVNKIGGSGASIVVVSIKTFHDRDGIDDCSNELGVRTNKIPDSRFFARNTFNDLTFHQPYRARLHLKMPGWCSAVNVPVSEYLQIDLGITKILSGIALQGHGQGISHIILKYAIEYSQNGLQWQFYKNDSNSIVVFHGIWEDHINEMETRVSWFNAIKAKFIRVVPTARLSPIKINCLRIELFGCSMSKTLLSLEWSPSSILSINDDFKGSFSVLGIMKSNLTTGLSSASDNESLAMASDQFHIYKINASTTLDNGTVVPNKGAVSLVTDPTRKIDSAGIAQFLIKEESYYAFKVDFAGKVIDSCLSTGRREVVLSTENKNGINVLTKPQNIERHQSDRSSLQLNVTTENSDNLVNDGYFHLNLSISNLPGRSKSNAYGVSVMIYFNTKFLQFKSIEFVNTSRFSLPPSRNTTTPGVIMIQTDTLWLLTRQKFSITLQAKYPKALSRGETCNEGIIIDLAYKANLAKFNGTVNSVLKKKVPFKCKIDQSRDIRVKSERLPSPEFSMVYDDVNQHFFFCYQRKTYMTKNSSICFSREKNNTFWKIIPYLSAVTGIDVEKRVLYGLERIGKSYVKSPYPFVLYNQIEDTDWTSAKDQPQMRLSSQSHSISLLSSYVSDPWIITVAKKLAFAGTSHGISTRTNELPWKRIVFWK